LIDILSVTSVFSSSWFW